MRTSGPMLTAELQPAAMSSARVRKRERPGVHAELAAQIRGAAVDLHARLAAVPGDIDVVARVAPDLEQRIAAAEPARLVPVEHQARRLAGGRELALKLVEQR